MLQKLATAAIENRNLVLEPLSHRTPISARRLRERLGQLAGAWEGFTP